MEGRRRRGLRSGVRVRWGVQRRPIRTEAGSVYSGIQSPGYCGRRRRPTEIPAQALSDFGPGYIRRCCADWRKAVNGYVFASCLPLPQRSKAASPPPLQESGAAAECVGGHGRASTTTTPPSRRPSTPTATPTRSSASSPAGSVQFLSKFPSSRPISRRDLD